MSFWSEVTVQPDAQALQALREGWAWLLGSDWTPILFSAIGDVFLILPAKTVWWLSTATGDLEQVADSQTAFTALKSTLVSRAIFTDKSDPSQMGPAQAF